MPYTRRFTSLASKHVMRPVAHTVIDLFSGAGGLSEGFREAGFSVLAANDFDDSAAATFKLNHPETAFLGGPIQDITADQLRDAAGLSKNDDLDVLVGGPPCQAFSVYNHQRGMHDERSGLFREYLRVVEGLMPRFVVMENVTGITSVGDGRAVEELYAGLQSLGYYVEHRILRSEDFGVPQERRRVFFVASRETKTISWPEPTHASPDSVELFTSHLKPFVTVWDALSDLPPLEISQGAEVASYGMEPQSDYQRLLREGSDQLFHHVAPFLSPVNIERLKHIPEGGSWRDIPFDLLPAGMQKARRSDHTKRYGRLKRTGLCCTVLTKCDLHWGSYIHPTQERTLTVREAARFQSFPDRIRFSGARMDQFKQVGNAVPPLLGQAVGNEISCMLQRVKEPLSASR